MNARANKVRVAVVVAAAMFLPAMAADVNKKFRLSVAIGGYNTQDEVRSDSANQLFVLDQNDTIFAVFSDPRDDAAVFNDLTIDPADRATIALQYAFKNYRKATVLIEGSVGYQKSDVGDIEVQAQFDRIPIPFEESFNFEPFQVPAGEMEQVPIQVSIISRFRPRANFNPYLGAGAGYTIVGFEPSPELDTLSVNMDQSVGGQAFLIPGLGGNIINTGGVNLADMDGGQVSARDTFAWHLVGGAELGFKKKWSLFLDFRYVFASRTMEIGFNGSDSLGISVPQLTDNLGPGGIDPGAVVFGPYFVVSGGIIDGGRLAPTVANPGADCATQPSLCEFVLEPDGELDTGFYYVQGGSIKYGGASLQLGLRYTF